jgi:hypothetical protein
MRIWSAVLIIALTFVYSCNEATEENKPLGLLSEEKMAEVLTDVRLLEGAYAGDFQRVDTSEYAIGAYYDQLFTKHQITRAAYLENYTYYANHPELMMKVETEVSRKLEVLSIPSEQ